MKAMPLARDPLVRERERSGGSRRRTAWLVPASFALEPVVDCLAGDSEHLGELAGPGSTPVELADALALIGAAVVLTVVYVQGAITRAMVHDALQDLLAEPEPADDR